MVPPGWCRPGPLQFSQAAHPELSAGFAANQPCISLRSVSLSAEGAYTCLSPIVLGKTKCSHVYQALRTVNTFQLITIRGISSVCKLA